METPNFPLETPYSPWKPLIFPDLLLETLHYLWKPQFFHWKPQINRWKPQIFPVFFWKLQIIFGNPNFPKFSIGNPKFPKILIGTTNLPLEKPNSPWKPKFSQFFLLETPSYLWQHQIFYWKHHFSKNLD